MKHLVIKAQKNDADAFIRLVELNQQSMYKVAKSYLSQDADVADAMQDTILDCFEKLHTLREPKYFKTWMIRILINNCKDILSHNKEICIMDEIPETADQNQPHENLEFMELIQSLDEKYSTILILFYVEGFNTREIGELLDMNERTVKTRLIRARQNFAKEFKNDLAYAGRLNG